MKKILIIIIAIALVGALVSASNSQKRKKNALVRGATNNSAQETPAATKPAEESPHISETPILKISFENETIKPSPTPANHDFLNTTLPSGETVPIPIQYEKGTLRDRYADIIDDPTKPGNKVLRYWLKNAAIPGVAGLYKGRAQLILGEINKTEATARYRMYLHPDLAHYQSYPKENSWFTINEFWAGEEWKNAPYPFRVTVNITKAAGAGKPLLLGVDGSQFKSGKWAPLWSTGNYDFVLPLGAWIDVEMYYKQGDKNSGRFWVKMKRPEDPTMVTVIDVHNATYDPNSPTPVPMTTWNPLKLYTSGKVIDHIRNEGGVAQIYWDDLEIWFNTP